MKDPQSQMRDKQVVRIVTRLNIGGPARHALILSRSLPALGYNTELVVGSPGMREGELTDDRVPLRRVPELQRELSPRNDVAAYKALSSILLERRPQIVHTHMAKAGALGRLAAVRAGVPLIVHTFHGHVLEGYFSRPKTALYLRLERWLAARTHALVAVSDAIRDELVELGIGTDDRWHVVPLGLDLEDLLASSRTPDTARDALGLPRDVPIVAIVGRLVPIKDHELFLEAARTVAEEFPDSIFLVVGDGELRPELEDRARSLLGTRVHFTGWMSDLVSLYAAADVVVLSSRNEGTPVALIEASAAARPVVATDVGGVTDVVLDGRSGYVVPPGDARALAEGVERLLRDRQLGSAFGAVGRSHVSSRFSSSRLISDVSDLYGRLLGTAS